MDIKKIAVKDNYNNFKDKYWNKVPKHMRENIDEAVNKTVKYRDTTKDECIIKFCLIFKRKSSSMIFERFSNLKYTYGNEDMIADQISFKEYTDPFEGHK